MIVSSVGVDGATVTRVAQRNGITRQQIYAWRHELKKKGLWSTEQGAVFLPVDVPTFRAMASEPEPVPPVTVEPRLASDLLHADDTPIRVLDRSAKKKEFSEAVKQGRIRTYVRDQRPWSGAAPPGVVYYFSPDRKGEHPRGHLANSSGILQADAYAGFKEPYERRVDCTQQFRKAACWAHPRRDFHDVWTDNQSEIAREALDRICKLYDIEREIAGQPAETRLAIRKKHSADKLAAFKA